MKIGSRLQVVKFEQEADGFQHLAASNYLVKGTKTGSLTRSVVVVGETLGQPLTVDQMKVAVIVLVLEQIDQTAR